MHPNPWQQTFGGVLVALAAVAIAAELVVTADCTPLLRSPGVLEFVLPLSCVVVFGATLVVCARRETATLWASFAAVAWFAVASRVVGPLAFRARHATIQEASRALWQALAQEHRTTGRYPASLSALDVPIVAEAGVAVDYALDPAEGYRLRVGNYLCDGYQPSVAPSVPPP